MSQATERENRLLHVIKSMDDFLADQQNTLLRSYAVVTALRDVLNKPLKERYEEMKNEMPKL
jgi:hypothetical protein